MGVTRLKKSTAKIVRVGPALDVTDGVTPETGITLSGADSAALCKSDGTVTSITSNTWSAVSGMDGYYNLTLTAANVDTVGQLMISILDAGTMFPIKAEFEVVDGTVYDTFVSGDEPIATEASIADAICDEALSGHTTAGTVGKAISDIIEDTAAMATTINARIEAYGLDHLVSTSVVGADVADNSIIARLVSKSATADWDSFVNTTDALEAISDAAVSVDATSVWGVVRGDHVWAAGSFGDYLDAKISTLVGVEPGSDPAQIWELPDRQGKKVTAVRPVVKQPDEVFWAAMEFAAVLPPNVEIASIDAVDDESTSIVTANSISDTQARLELDGGTDGDEIRISVTITDTKGNVRIGDGLLVVQEQ